MVKYCILLLLRFRLSWDIAETLALGRWKLSYCCVTLAEIDMWFAGMMYSKKHTGILTCTEYVLKVSVLFNTVAVVGWEQAVGGGGG